MMPLPGKKKKSLDNYARYSGMAFEMLLIILIGVFGGIKLDEWLNMKAPVFTIVLSVLAVILSIYSVTRGLLKNDRNKKKSKKDEK
jgi:F0F1-type ATP synthase assembly protein I